MNFFTPLHRFLKTTHHLKGIIWMTLGLALSQNAMDANGSETTGELPNKRLYVAVDEKLLPAQQVESIHAVVKELGKKVPAEQLALLPYIDESGIEYENISAYPFIVLKGNQAKLKELGNLTNPECTIASTNNGTNSTAIAAVAAFGLVDILQPVTKRFGIYKPKASPFTPFVETFANSADDEEADFCFISEKLEPGNMLNSLSHMTIGMGNKECNRFYSGTTTEEKLLDLWVNCRKQNLTHVTFLDTMHLGPTYKEQIFATRMKPTNNLRVTGLYVHGKLGVLRLLI